MIGSDTYRRAVADARGHGRVLELNALRGIAAVLVLAYHALLYHHYAGPVHRVAAIVLNAHGAVVGFFVLSGFALAMSLVETPSTPRGIGAFLLRRVYRIYPALWLGCALGLLCLLVTSRIDLPSASAWVSDNFSTRGFGPGRIALAFAGLKSTLPLPIWSLAVEIVASLLMPLVVIVMRRSTAAFVLLCAMLALAALFDLQRPFLVPTYMASFALGAGIVLVAPFWRRAMAIRGGVPLSLATAFALLWGARAMTGADIVANYHDGTTTLIEGLGAALLIATLHVRAGGTPVLRRRSFLRLGDWSYSLYLLHQPLLGLLAMPLAMLALPPWLASPILLAATLLATLPLARLSFRQVERRGIAAGHRHAARLLDETPARPAATAVPLGGDISPSLG